MAHGQSPSSGCSVLFACTYAPLCSIESDLSVCIASFFQPARNAAATRPNRSSQPCRRCCRKSLFSGRNIVPHLREHARWTVTLGRRMSGRVTTELYSRQLEKGHARTTLQLVLPPCLLPQVSNFGANGLDCIIEAEES